MAWIHCLEIFCLRMISQDFCLVDMTETRESRRILSKVAGQWIMVNVCWCVGEVSGGFSWFSQ